MLEKNMWIEVKDTKQTENDQQSYLFYKQN